jgi:hypothetical protein
MIREAADAVERHLGEGFSPTSRTPCLPPAHRAREEAWNTAGLGHFPVRCVLWDDLRADREVCSRCQVL